MWRRRTKQGSALPQGFDPADEASHLSESAGPAGDERCGCEDCDLPLMAHVTQDPFERLTLFVLRYFMAGYCTGNVEYWDRAIQVSTDALGPGDGIALYGQIIALGQAIRCERTIDFHFMGTRCGKISRDEIALLSVLRAAREGDRMTAHLQIEHFTQSLTTPMLWRAMHDLVAVFAPKPRPARPAEMPDPVNLTRH
jgi:hypothetical protein